MKSRQEVLSERPELRELITMEHGSLREELRGLKNCQVTFVTFAVTTAGAVLGLGSGIQGLPKAIVYLAPLLVLLPTWLIFFDKATSINRIVGYVRIIETVLLQPERLKTFPGWENALAKYRGRQAELRPDTSNSRWNLRHMTKYHGIIFLTYLLLVSTCLWLAWPETGTTIAAWWLWEALFVCSIITVCLNMRYLFQLSWGKYSSRATHQLWTKILLE